MSKLANKNLAIGAAVYLAGYLATDLYWYINTYNNKYCNKNFTHFHENYMNKKGFKAILWPLFLPCVLLDKFGENIEFYKSKILYSILESLQTNK